MTKEEKQLLLIDLSARLPQHVKIHTWYGEVVTSDLNTFPFSMDEMDEEEDLASQLSGIKPYLRPMSSMTEEEVKEIQKINWQFCKPKNDLDECSVESADDGYCSVSQMTGILDYLNAHHFDFRGLIPMGLALEAPKDMYKIE